MDNSFCLESLNVSCETIEMMNNYVDLLSKWNSAINLVSKSSFLDVWHRHILNSAQLLSYVVPEKTHWVDLGSGAGFPGIVISILAKDKFPLLKMTLIESDQRKCVFLNEVSRELKLDIIILSDRIENCSNLKADIISARALAPMSKLLEFFQMHSGKNCKALFLKGERVYSELNQINKIDLFQITVEPSLVGGIGYIVTVNRKEN